MPIIVVFTKTQDENISEEMSKFIDEQKLDVLFVPTVAKDIILDKENNSKIKPYGKEELLKNTLEIGTKSLQGGLITLMVKNISKDLIQELKEENKNNENKLKEGMVNSFINDYKNVLKDGEFVEYLINIIVNAYKKFYGENYEISRKTYNLINKSKFVTYAKRFIKLFKKDVRNIINPIIKEKSKDLIDSQAQNEKNFGNLELKNKRRLKGFQKTSEIFLKKNFYYIVQKFIINYSLQNIFQNNIGNYRKTLDLIVEELLNVLIE